MSEEDFPVRTPIISTCISTCQLSSDCSWADLPSNLSLIVQHFSPTSSTPGYHNLILSPSSEMRDPKKCGVFNPNTNEQCGYPKVSKLKGKQGTVFEPAFLGELCTRHGRDYLERKPLKYIEGVDPPAATESIAGDWEEPPTEGAFEVSIQTCSSKACR